MILKINYTYEQTLAQNEIIDEENKGFLFLKRDSSDRRDIHNEIGYFQKKITNFKN